MSDLESAILCAHTKGHGETLAKLYAEAAHTYIDDQDRAAFYLTQAYVFALEAGMQEALIYHTQLKSWGKEQ